MKIRDEYLFCYDIEQTKIRTKVYKQLLAYGLHPVQKSVLWGFVSKPELSAIQRMLDMELQQQDKALITRVHFSQEAVSYSFGYKGFKFKDWEEFGQI